MLLRKSGGGGITQGLAFYRYYPKMGYAYDKGEVTKCLEAEIEVDFGDTLVVFLMTEIAYVVNTDLCDEHFMSFESGRVISDYRSTPKPSAVTDDMFGDLLSQIM